ncbi:ASKHA domain-containing protein [Desulfosporosinus sp. PR]|uniref:ASKHA domain-containing protein n=1 Tax=Candidatus Desulfosporosinus nitrosoreducens TaxID=3401928 RepID=UPI0027FBCBBC|nr:ASKHA domain-containing protein [Desulfosporosinus sp. PR]MDQ7093572.1 ASKHA domain-containing protein [Desulfosporosinus sp. PR]
MDQKNSLSDVEVTVNGTRKFAVPTHETLLSSLTKAGIMLEAACGGQGFCGKCRIRLLSGQVVDQQGSPLKPGQDGWYLACQVYPGEDLVLERAIQVSVSSKGEISDPFLEQADLLPPLKKVLIRPVYPSLENNYSLQEMIRQVFAGEEDISIELRAVQELALIAPQKFEEITVLRSFKQIIGFEPGDTSSTLYGVAFDLGTTTVAGMLVDLQKGKVIAAAAETNPQTAYGADVIARIKAAGTEDELNTLMSAVRKCLNDLVAKLCARAGVANKDIYLVTVAGNSTMEHLLMGVSPKYLTVSPYVPVFNNLPHFSASAIELDLNPGASFILLPNIAGFVGADTVAAIVGVDQDLTSKLTLLIDLGTNGEIVLGNKEKMLVCSTAAGPAFEGAQLSSGMRAANGAIDEVEIRDDVCVHTVKEELARGICGSGVIKAIAEFLKAGIITPSGRFVSNDRFALLPPKLSKRLKVQEGQKEFVLVFAEESASGRDIAITQGDIREIQLVKSSIFTGIETLMENYGVMFKDIEQVLLAGAFGNNLNLDSALAIGLLPSAERKKILPVGNAAGTGAVKALLSVDILERCRSIAQRAQFVELANHPGFQAKFIKNLTFPEGV